MIPKMSSFGTETIVLWHGTISGFDEIDVECGERYKDFGRGFYTGISRTQAAGMASYKQRRHQRLTGELLQKKLYRFDFDERAARAFNRKHFLYADEEWFKFVAMCRKAHGRPHKYDIVIGPTADDDTRTVIDAYLGGLYGAVGSEGAIAFALKQLEVENLGIQYYFGSNEAAQKCLLRMEVGDI